MPAVDDFCLPFVAHVNPNADKIHASHLEWLTTNGILPKEAAARYEAWKLTEYTAVTYPWASADDLKTAADLYGWLSLFDDYLDGSKQRSLAETRTKCAAITAVIHGQAPTADPAADPFVGSFADVWSRLSDGMSEYWLARHRRNWQAYLNCYAWENTARATAYTPPLEEYLEHRRWSSVMDATFDLIERFNRSELPRCAAEDPRFETLHLLAVRIVLVVNDVFSAEKEEEDGDPYALLKVLGHHENLTYNESLTRAKQLLAQTVEKYLDVERDYLSSWWHHGLPRQEMTTLEALTTGMRVWFRGNIDWHLRTSRYGHNPHIEAPVPAQAAH